MEFLLLEMRRGGSYHLILTAVGWRQARNCMVDPPALPEYLHIYTLHSTIEEDKKLQPLLFLTSRQKQERKTVAFSCGEGFNIVRVRATAKVRVRAMARVMARVLSRISSTHIKPKQNKKTMYHLQQRPGGLSTTFHTTT